VAFDEQVAWLAVHTSKTAVVQLMRIAWRTVGAICGRVDAGAEARVDRLVGLRRIGIDEVSCSEVILSPTANHGCGLGSAARTVLPTRRCGGREPVR
jgi:hypothetical protein